MEIQISRARSPVYEGVETVGFGLAEARIIDARLRHTQAVVHRCRGMILPLDDQLNHHHPHYPDAEIVGSIPVEDQAL